MHKHITEDSRLLFFILAIAFAILLSKLLYETHYRVKNPKKLKIAVIIFFIIFNLVNIFIFRIAKYEVPILYRYLLIPAIAYSFSAFIFIGPKPKE